MGKHLNPLEKEFLIRQYKGSTQKMSDFCEKVGVSTGAFQKWLKQYEEQGLEEPKFVQKRREKAHSGDMSTCEKGNV